MSNRKKRDKRRQNAESLRDHVKWLKQQEHVCPECGLRGAYHWVSVEQLSLAHLVSSVPPKGFWVCPKFYDPETKRRIAA